MTASMWAASVGDTESARLLLSYHADYKLRNSAGKTALQIAMAEGMEAVVGILQEQQLDNPTLLEVT